MNDIWGEQEEIDPFDDGTDVPRLVKGDTPQEESWGVDLTEIMGNAPAKFKKADHNIRTRDLYEKYGYFVFRVDQTRTSYGGSIYTVDFLGLFDWMAIKEPNEIVGIQVCAKSAIGSHITKMTSTEVTSFNKGRKIDNLMKWLECGCRVELVGWEKVGARWQPTIRKLDMVEVEKAMARKRKAS